jgi:hypothetical protein
MAKSPPAANILSFVATVSDSADSIDDFTPPLSIGARRCNSNELAIIGAKITVDLLQRIKQTENGNYHTPGYLRQWHLQAKSIRARRNNSV